MRRKHIKVFHAIERSKRRLAEKNPTFPYVFVAGALLVLILLNMTNFNVDHRLGHKTDPLIFPGKQKEATGIWLALNQDQDEIVVSTSSKSVFRWKSVDLSSGDYERFRKFLFQRVKAIVHDNALSENYSDRNSEAVLALDQTLTYAQIKPVLQALADARISRYAFETKIVDVNESETGHK